MTRRLKAAVLGATGMVGQRFVSLLDNHPNFHVTELVASERSAGKRYADAVNWVLADEQPAWARDVEVKLPTDDLDADVCFSAIPAGKAGPLEVELAKKGHRIFSNARDHRWDDDVPLLLPEVNPDHLELVKRQGTDGFIVTGGNCSTIVMALTLKPLQDAFGVKRVNVTTYQAISGAGYPGVPSIDILGNVIPHIGGEETKMEREPRRMLGTLTDTGVSLADFTVSASCVRVPVEESHTEDVRIEFERAASPAEVEEAFRQWRPRPQELKLPSAPQPAVVIAEEDNRPQPRKDWRRGNGMAVTVGRIREDPHAHVKYFLTGSNTVRGAAGGNILGAELALAEGYL